MPARLKVAYVLRSWPRLSQTFILNEIRELERLGVAVSILALVRSGESLVQAEVADVRAPVRYLEASPVRRATSHLHVLSRSPWRYARTLAYAHRRRQLFGGYTESGPSAAFGAAVRAADELARQGRDIAFSHIHAHFAHDPALVALLVHQLTGLPFTFTAHARDLYQIPDRALVARAREAVAVITCCRANHDHISRVVAHAAPVELIYHGVDRRRFAPAGGGMRPGAPLILSVGRLVEKKGFDDLLEACAVLAGNGKRFRCAIYGDGPDRGRLESLRDRLGLGEAVSFEGARTHAELVPAFQRADIFALTPRVTEDGDRDGVPNVLLEAMACAKPVVSTPVGGIAEVVRDGVSGLLIGGRDTAAIAAGIGALLDDAALRQRLGAGAAQTAADFDGRNAARRLAALFRGAESQR